VSGATFSLQMLGDQSSGEAGKPENVRVFDACLGF